MFQSIKSCLTKVGSIRSFSNTSQLANSYKQWPYEKVRRIGRRPEFTRGQGGKRSRIAYDKRYKLSGKFVNATTEGLRRGGNEYMPRIIGEERARNNSAVIKYYDYNKEREITEVVPEMIPEFIVPDLKGFTLKPYVSYRVNETVQTQPPHTAAQLFQETYQRDLEKLKKG